MENVLLLRLDELDTPIRPVDAVGNLAELAATGAALPAVTEAAVGRGRLFVSGDAEALAAVDLVPGTTLLTRDASIQVILSWDLPTAAAYGNPQTIYARGKGTGAAEYVGAGLELRVVNAATRVGEVRWIWHDIAGNLKTQIGGHFQLPATGFVMLTATRRWVSSSRVVLRYYLGDALLSEIESADGDIAGGTTGTTSLGARFTGGAWARLFDGVIDELRVVDGELSAEEVAATYDRITVQQPRGYKLLRDAHDPGFPISGDPASRAQRETRMFGEAFGFAAAQAENIRNNILPDRAYGKILERWEAITKPAPSPRPGDSVERRRARVIGRLRQRRGISIPGAGDALRELLDTDPANLRYLAFDQTVRDDLSALLPLRWDYQPAAAWTISGGKTRVQSAVARTAAVDLATMLLSVGGNGEGAAMLAAFAPTTIATDGEVGMVFLNRITWTGFFFGLRRDPSGAAIQVVTEPIRNQVFAGATVRAALGGAVLPVWLRMRAGVTGIMNSSSDVRVLVEWSTVSSSGPWTSANALVPFGRSFQWAGFHARTVSGAASAIDVKISGAAIRAPKGSRSFRWYVLRDPAIPGDPDLLAADQVGSELEQAHTDGHVITSTTAVCDSYVTPCDVTPMGGL